MGAQTNQTDSPFVAWLRARMAGRTHGQLATYLEVDRSTVSRWVSGEISPDYRNVVRLARYFDTDPAEIEALLPRDDTPSLTEQMAQIRQLLAERLPAPTTPPASTLARDPDAVALLARVQAWLGTLSDEAIAALPRTLRDDVHRWRQDPTYRD